MSSPQNPGGPSQYHQHNHARRGGHVIANQGSGNQTVNLYALAASRKRTGTAVLIFLGIDVVFFFYGMLSYSARAEDSGDMWRAGIYLVLLSITGSLIRRWFRQRV